MHCQIQTKIGQVNFHPVSRAARQVSANRMLELFPYCKRAHRQLTNRVFAPVRCKTCAWEMGRVVEWFRQFADSWRIVLLQWWTYDKVIKKWKTTTDADHNMINVRGGGVGGGEGRGGRGADGGPGAGRWADEYWLVTPPSAGTDLSQSAKGDFRDTYWGYVCQCLHRSDGGWGSCWLMPLCMLRPLHMMMYADAPVISLISFDWDSYRGYRQ